MVSPSQHSARHGDRSPKGRWRSSASRRSYATRSFLVRAWIDQLRHRDHYVRLTHPFIGDGDYERNGFRLSDGDGGYERSAPTLGQDNGYVLGEILGLSPDEQAGLEQAGTLS